MGFERLAPQREVRQEVTSGQSATCKHKGCSNPATGHVFINLVGPSREGEPALQLGGPIRVPMCDEHLGKEA